MFFKSVLFVILSPFLSSILPQSGMGWGGGKGTVFFLRIPAFPILFPERPYQGLCVVCHVYTEGQCVPFTSVFSIMSQ